MFASFSLETFRLGLSSIRLHKLRSFLTTLGIICGVGAVICMLSIGEGASEAEMALIRLLGTHNVIIKSVKPQGGGDVSEARSQLLEYGLTRFDLALIRETIPHVKQVIPLREVAFEVSYAANRFQATVVGAPPAFFQLVHVGLSEGRFLTDLDNATNSQVCVIGQEIRNRLFAFEDPLGRVVSVATQTGMIPFVVVGVLERVATAGLPARGTGERDLNTDVFIPMSTADARYSDLQIRISTGTRDYSRVSFSDFYVEVDSLEQVLPVSEMLKAALASKHTKQDYVVLDGVEGPGMYMGTVIGVRALSGDWWGEGEMKFYLDGDTEFPTICGTGAEDYFLAAYGMYEFQTPYHGCTLNLTDDFFKHPLVSMYRWHGPDPIYFNQSLKATIQQIGYRPGALFERSDDWCSTAFWYQIKPISKVPPFPDREARTAGILDPNKPWKKK